MLMSLIMDNLPDDFVKTQGIIEENEKNICKLSFKGMTANAETDMENNLLGQKMLLLVNVQTDQGEKGYSSGWDYCERVVKKLHKVLHVTYSNESGDPEIVIDSIRLRGNINQIGINSQGIYCFSINFIVDYFEY